MNYDPVIQAWRIKDNTGRDLFLFHLDGSITFAKVSPHAKIRFAPDGSGLEVSDGQNWREIPFTYAGGATATVPPVNVPTFITSLDLTTYGSNVPVTATSNPQNAAADGAIHKPGSPLEP